MATQGVEVNHQLQLHFQQWAGLNRPYLQALADAVSVHGRQW
jgi:hypothetical protein